LASRDVQRHRTSKKELDDIRALIARDLADAGVAALSADRRFATAYNAALLTAHMVIACAGYRVTAKTGHHKVAFDGITLSANATLKTLSAIRTLIIAVSPFTRTNIGASVIATLGSALGGSRPRSAGGQS